MSRRILIIDDEIVLAKNIKTYLTRHGYDARIAESGERGLAALDVVEPDIVLLDYQLDDMSGLDVLNRIRERGLHLKVVLMTGHGGVQLAVDVMKAGAHDYLSKPVVLAELRRLLDKALGQERLEGALAYYQGKQARQSGLDKLVGNSTPMLAVKHKIQRLIEVERRLEQGTPPVVLITGETGTGKELAARAFHFDGPRQNEAFVEINCASIPGHLMESELFGFERGAFTDAKQRKLGLVESANGGTLFLDEIGDLDLSLQAKLLRLLEERTVRRLGGLRDHRVDVRIIAATNHALEERVQRGEFRADLFYRLRIIQIELPVLRARGDDILHLAKEFLEVQSKRYGKSALQLSRDAERALRHYAWPGNVRELRNAIEQSVLLAQGDTIEPKHLALSPVLNDSGVFRASDGRLPEDGVDLQQVEVGLVTQALERADWNVTRAATLLGLSRDTLRYRMQKHKLRPAP